MSCEDDDDDGVPDGIRQEIERLKDKSPEITPVLSRGQAEEGPITPDLRRYSGPAAVVLPGNTVLHAPSSVVGVVKRVYGPGEYRVESGGVETSGRPVSEAVVELEDGNAFLLRPGSFTVLGALELRFWELAVGGLREVVENVTALGARYGLARGVVLTVIRSALSAQLRVLDPGAVVVPSK